jgi:hypothetical protein
MMRWLPSVILFAGIGAAADDLPTPQKVHFAACTATGVEPNCIVARGDDGVLYNVGGALPGLEARQWLQGTAAVTDRITYCMQGRTIGDFTPDQKQSPARCGE